jgi:cytochrome c
MFKKNLWVAICLVAAALVLVGYGLQADEFTDQDLERWQGEYMTVVNEGRALWGSPKLGTNGVACGQCHPNAANTHPETYPKFQQQLGRVVAFREMINWCIMNPLEGQTLALDDRQMIALEAYATYERRGVPLAPGKH